MSKLRAMPVCAAIVVLLAISPPAFGQQAAVGFVEGRVLNATNGTYLANARVTIKGTSAEVFTDEDGTFRIVNVPIGEKTITVFYTGLNTVSETVSIAQGKLTRKDFELGIPQGVAGETPVALAAFVVEARKEYNAQSIATNEQRFAPHLKNVVSKDEFGDIGEGNMGEFLKYVPGVDVAYDGGIVARTASVRGFPASTTLLTLDGGEVANVGYSALAREANLDLMTTNNVARVEVFKSPTPDKPANMLGGAINVISKTAFEQRRPLLSYRAFATLNSKHAGDRLRPSPGMEGEDNPIQPGFELSYVAPVTPNFGFSASATQFSRHNQTDTYPGTWNLNNPPVLTGSTRNSSPQMRRGGSVGGTADWRITPTNIVTGNFSYTEKYAGADNTALAAALGNGAVGDASFSQSAGAVGSVTMTSGAADRYDRGTHGALRWKHTGPVWRIDAGSFYSYSTSKARNIDKGKFGYTAGISSLSMRLEGIGTGPTPFNRTIAARTAAGAPVDVYDSRNYTLRTITSNQRNALGTKLGFNLDAERSVAVIRPVRVKVGASYRRDDFDQRAPNRTWTFVGPDGIANNADNRVGLYDIQSASFSKYEQVFDTPKTQWISPYKLYENLFRPHPEYFTFSPATNISTDATQRRKLTEIIQAGYLRADVKVIDNKLLLVGGVRFEETEDRGAGVLNDLTATFRKDARGELVRDAAGRPIPISTDPVASATLRYQTLAARAARTYSGYYPSLNVSYNLTDSVIARAAYARTIGRPNFSNIIPGTTISDPDVAEPTITVSNTALRPWSADAFDLAIEAYYGANSVTSFGVYRKNVSNLFGVFRGDATEDLLAEYSLSPEYLDYTVVTQKNIGAVTVDGIEFSHRQALVFLPHWARGIQIFGNGIIRKISGPQEADLREFGGSQGSFGLSLGRQRFSLRLNGTYVAKFKGELVAASATVPPGTYDYQGARLLFDMSVEVRLSRHFGVYFTARNLFNEGNDGTLRYAPSTPAYARLRNYGNTGAFLTMGIKGEF